MHLLVTILIEINNGTREQTKYSTLTKQDLYKLTLSAVSTSIRAKSNICPVISKEVLM